MTDHVRTVAASEWAAAAEDASGDGYDYLDLVAGIDRREAVEVVARLVRRDASGCDAVRLVTQVVMGEALASLTSLYPAAAWHERELVEMFDVRLTGHPDLRPLLRRQQAGSAPLLRSTVLAARVARPWPGAAEGGDDRRGSRRRQAPPGVVADWLEREDA